MEFSKYSKEAFVEARKDEKHLQTLTAKLHDEIQSRLHPLVVAELETIVRALNEQGHNLRLRYTPTPGDVHFRDNHDGKVDLLIACDTVITVDFGSAIENKDIF